MCVCGVWCVLCGLCVYARCKCVCVLPGSTGVRLSLGVSPWLLVLVCPRPGEAEGEGDGS